MRIRNSRFGNLTGPAQGDMLAGDAGNNVTDGCAGNDTLNGGGGEDNLPGGTGDDNPLNGAGAEIADSFDVPKITDVAGPDTAVTQQDPGASRATEAAKGMCKAPPVARFGPSVPGGTLG